VICSSCNYDQYHNKNFKLIEEKDNTSLYFSDISFDTAAFENYLFGFRIDLQISKYGLSFKKNLLETFGSDCNGYEIYLEVCDKNGHILKKQKDSYDSTGVIDLADSTILFNPTGSKNSFFFPYRLMGLKDGMNEILINISTIPVYTYKDKNNNTVCKHLSAKHDITAKLKISLDFPHLYMIRIFVKKFLLDTTKFDPSQCDFHIFGPGYPDPMYSIASGTHLIYASRHYRNIINFPDPDTSVVFACTNRDCFTIDILDYDSWGRSDLLAETVGSPFRISHDIKKPSRIHFGYLKYLDIASIINN
jgi:hypothetical protein